MACYDYQLPRSHNGQQRPPELCEETRRKFEEDQQKFADRKCVVVGCGIALPAGSTVVNGRCSFCESYFRNHGKDHAV